MLLRNKKAAIGRMEVFYFLLDHAVLNKEISKVTSVFNHPEETIFWWKFGGGLRSKGGAGLRQVELVKSTRLILSQSTHLFFQCCS